MLSTTSSLNTLHERAAEGDTDGDGRVLEQRDDEPQPLALLMAGEACAAEGGGDQKRPFGRR